MKTNNTQRNTTPSFFPHLEGLRGFAIILILFFHLGTTGIHSPITLSGGYLGVEIFIVLTGFLLALGFSRRSESFLTFLRKKLLRIMFPVSVLIVATMCACLFCMDYFDLCATAKNAWYALLGCSNIQLSIDGAEYFATNQAYNPLLHMWYIAITLQLYLVIYLGWLLVRYFPKWGKVTFLLTIAVLSYVYGHCHTLRAELVAAWELPLWMSQEGSMYYSTFARLWEPLLGMSVLILPTCSRKIVSTCVCACAAIAIAYSVWYQPTYAMLLTACSSALLIKYGDCGFLTPILNNKGIRFIGKISFSIYLVHMPFFVCYKCATFTSLSYTTAILLTVLSVILGWVFWFLIEKRHIPFWGLLLMWLTGLGLSLLFEQTSGLKKYWNKETNRSMNNLCFVKYDQFRFRKDNELDEHFDKKAIPCYGERLSLLNKLGTNHPKGVRPYLQIGVDSETPSFVLIGDSHAYMSYAGLDTICKENEISGIQMHTLLLPVWNRSFGDSPRHPYSISKTKIEAFMRWLQLYPEIKNVVIIFSWTRITNDLKIDWKGRDRGVSTFENMECMEQFLLELKKIGKNTIMFTPYPRFAENDCRRYARTRLRLGIENSPHQSAYTQTKADYDHQWRECIQSLKKLEAQGLCSIIEVAPYFFRKGSFHAVEGNKLLYMDSNHFGADISMDMARYFSKDIVQLLKPTHQLDNKK